jgi:hypothetical protein
MYSFKNRHCGIRDFHHRCSNIASLSQLSNSASWVGRSYILPARKQQCHSQQEQQQPQRVFHVRSITTTTSSTDNPEYKNFSHKLLTIEEEEEAQSHPSSHRQQPKDKLVFGKQFTPHMLQIQYSHRQWSEPKIVPFQNLTISPAASSLHYGTSIYVHVVVGVT